MDAAPAGSERVTYQLGHQQPVERGRQNLQDIKETGVPSFGFFQQAEEAGGSNLIGRLAAR